MSLIKKIKSIYKLVKETLDETGGERSPNAKPVSPIIKKEFQKLTSRISDWQQIENAKYFRAQCPCLTGFIFQGCKDYEATFGSAVATFFAVHGNWRICQSYPDIHITFMAVDVFQLLDRWNQRNINIKQILLTELRQSYMSYAETKNIHLGDIFNGLVANAWLINTTLVLELPDSVFSLQYPDLSIVLAPDSYMDCCNGLNRRSTI